MGKKSTKEEFVLKSRNIHDNKYDYSKVEYLGNKTKVIIICPKHGEFKQSPHAHLTGIGCPYCRESRGEKKVAEILKKNNIQFERQITFNNLKDISNLYYDFYLPKYRLFIEYEGHQHYTSIPFFGGNDSLLKTKRHDMIKYKYAINNGYKLLKIRFVSLNYLEELLVNILKEIPVVCVA